MTDHEAKAREIADRIVAETTHELRGKTEAGTFHLVHSIPSISKFRDAISAALREAEERATLAERGAWQARMKTASDMLAQMEAAGITQETRNELIGCLDPKILRSDDDIAEMEAQFAAAIRSTTDE